MVVKKHQKIAQLFYRVSLQYLNTKYRFLILLTGMTELLKSIRLFILLMCHYQDTQTRLQAEIDNVIGK
jgi:hypothetical protein